MNDKTALIIFAREPQEGKVKTRLSEDLPLPIVTELYKAFILDVIAEVLKAHCDQKMIFFTPAHIPIPFLKGFYLRFLLRPQEGASLGDRMHNAFEYCHQKHFKRVIIVGTDCVTLTGQDIERGFERLRDHDCVLGPATDGGYYLIGLKEPEAKIFSDIEWGTSHVLDQTIRWTGELNKITFLLRENRDIDTMRDLEHLSRSLKGTDIALHTQEILKKIGK